MTYHLGKTKKQKKKVVGEGGYRIHELLFSERSLIGKLEYPSRAELLYR